MLCGARLSSGELHRQRYKHCTAKLNACGMLFIGTNAVFGDESIFITKPGRAARLHLCRRQGSCDVKHDVRCRGIV